MQHYILENGVPKKVTIVEWGLWFSDIEKRRIEQTEVGPFFVSTVFLGFDHSLRGDGSEMYETMVFNGEETVECHRTPTLGEAKKQHFKTVRDMEVKLSRNKEEQ